MNEQHGYAVEFYADAPMRVRAWFESDGEAHGYASQRGGDARVRVYASPMVAGDALDAVKAAADELADEIAYLTRALDTANRDKEAAESDARRAEEEADNARDDRDNARAELARVRKEAA